jgi:hypothetical protein
MKQTELPKGNLKLSGQQKFKNKYIAYCDSIEAISK